MIPHLLMRLSVMIPVDDIICDDTSPVDEIICDDTTPVDEIICVMVQHLLIISPT